MIKEDGPDALDSLAFRIWGSGERVADAFESAARPRSWSSVRLTAADLAKLPPDPSGTRRPVRDRAETLIVRWSLHTERGTRLKQLVHADENRFDCLLSGSLRPSGTVVPRSGLQLVAVARPLWEKGHATVPRTSL